MNILIEIRCLLDVEILLQVSRGIKPIRPMLHFDSNKPLRQGRARHTGWIPLLPEREQFLSGLRLQDGGIVVSSSLGLIRRKLSFSYSPFLQLPGCIIYTLLGQAPLSWLPWWQCFLDSILYCLTAIVYPSFCLKLKTCGQRPFWPDFQRIHFFFLHCRTSARLGRSTTGVSL